MKKLLIAALLCSFLACHKQEAAFALAESKRGVYDGYILRYMDCILVKNAPKDRAELKRLMIYHFLRTASGTDTLQTHPELEAAMCCFIKSTPKTRTFFTERKEYAYGGIFDEEVINAKTIIGIISIDRCKEEPANMTVVLWLPVEGKYEDFEDFPDEDAHVLLNECEPDRYEANKDDEWVMYYTALATAAAPSVVIDSGRFTDARDGKTYKSVKIGNQTWMAENLNYKTGGSECYDGDDSNCNKYGRLYDWNTASSACPSGWRLPTGREWDTLIAAAGGDMAAGKKLKAKAAPGGGYVRPGIIGGATDDFGFSATYGGSRYKGANVFPARYYGNWWTATEYGDGYAYYREMIVDRDRVREYGCAKGCGLSVRCVRDY